MSEHHPELHVAAVQWGSWFGASVAARRNRISDLVAKAADRGASLIVLPRLSDCAVFGDDMPQGFPDLGQIAFESPEREEFFACLAVRHGVILVHSIVSRADTRMVEKMVCRMPDGRIAAEVLRLHTASEQGLCGGNDITPADLNGMRIGFVCGDDAWSPEQCRILALLNCDILISPQALRKPYRKWTQVAGLWQQIQQNQVFGVEACLTGGAFSGRSAILAPCDIRPGFSGYLTEAPDETSDCVLTAVLKAQDLAHARRTFPIFAHFNVDLYRRASAGKVEGGEQP